MENNNNIQNELETISALVASIPKVEVYEVPEGYFDMLCVETLKSVTNNPNCYTVPEDYFQQLPSNIATELYQTEDSAAFSKVNPFETPENYFNQLAASTLAEVKKNQSKSTIQKRIIQLCVAAIFIAFVGFGIQFISSKNTQQPTTEANGLVINFNNDEATFDQINETDYVEFLTENGHDVNAALVATLTDEQSLPAEEDYILDNNKLETYLETLNINTKGTTTN
jgi:hypothetical protein